MRKMRLFPLLMAAAIAMSAASGCSAGNGGGCNFSYRIQIKATSNPYNSLNPLTWSESP